MHGCSTARISSPQGSPDGEAESIQIVETAATFVIDWKGNYRINAPAFVDSDRDTGRVISILGYPTDKLDDTG